MRHLPLTQDRYALVDDEDYDVLARHRWYYLPNDRAGYAVRHVRTPEGRTVTIYLHRYLLRAAPHEHVDHADGDGLNNQRSNLRLSSPSENMANRRARARAVPYRGVYQDRRRPGYFAQISIGHQSRRLGTFATAEAAARAYDVAAYAAWGRFARLNFPHELPALVEQLALPLDDEHDDFPPPPALPIGREEIGILRGWRAARSAMVARTVGMDGGDDGDIPF